MSEANVEIVKGIYAAWERGDFSSVDWADPEIEYSVPGPEGAERGIEAMSRSWREWLRVFKGFSVVPEEFHDAGDQVVVIQKFAGEGRGSGISVEHLPGAAVLTLRDGNVVRFRGYVDPDAALADAGVR